MLNRDMKVAKMGILGSYNGRVKVVGLCRLASNIDDQKILEVDPPRKYEVPI